MASRWPRRQLLFSREDDVGRLVFHFFLDQWHGDAGEVRAERLKAVASCPINRAKKPGYALHVENVDELVGRSMRRRARKA